jgi:hypothetical protein
MEVIKNDGNTQDILQNTNDHVTVLNWSKTYLVHKYYNRSQSTSEGEKGLGELLSISKPLLTEIDGQSE